MVSDTPMPTPTTPTSATGLRGHLVACAAGAGIDNVYRVAVGTALATLGAKMGGAAGGEAGAIIQASWGMILFSLPFVLFAPTAGSLGDRFAKHHLIRLVRLADIACLALGAVALWYQQTALLLATVLAFATVSAFFAPVKLAVIPELVGHDRLPGANAALAAFTVVAIVLGMALAMVHDPALLKLIGLGELPPVIAVTVVGVAICAFGIWGAFRIPPLQPRNPDARIAMPWHLAGQFSALSGGRRWVPAICLAAFWSLGGVASVGVTVFTPILYHISEMGVALLSVQIAIGLIIGSILAPKFLHPAYPAGLPILGALLSGGGILGAGWAASQVDPTITAALSEQERLLQAAWQIGPWLLLCGLGGGLWEVPLTILLQERTDVTNRSVAMAGVSVLSSLGTVVLVLIVLLLASGWLGVQLSTAGIFLLLGGITVAGSVLCLVIYRLQVAGWLIAVGCKLWWRGSASGLDHLPRSGGALIACNHLSFADGLALMGLLPRRPRFLVYRKYFTVPVVGFFLRAAGAIPVAAEDSRRALLAAIETAIEAAKSGELVAIFPEGKLTRSGTTDKFRGGIERIATRAGVPVVPAWLSGFWGSAWSKDRNWRILHLERARIRLGSPLSSTCTAAEARAAVITLSYDEASAEAARDPRTLGSTALSLARRHPFGTCVRDAQGELPAWKALAIARALLPLLALKHDESRIGIVLPPGRAGTLANLALALAGRTAVNLNHTVGATQLARMCELAGVTTIISATPYLKRIGNPQLPGRTVLVEELLPKLSKWSVIAAGLRHLLLPASWCTCAKADDVAAIIFSSGSTGDPKGVQLTHRQILANCKGVVRGLDLQPFRDVLCSPLPLFHSFGLVPGMWLGLTEGLTVIAHPDPRDGDAIGKLIASGKATFAISTPSFVRGWMRRIEPEQLKSLRFVVVGAERCPLDLRVQFREKYGSELLEGYGCTELAPVVAFNQLDVKRDGEHEIRTRDGSVGRPIPGVRVFATDPESQAVLPEGQEGLLVVQSPSRMLGYLHRDDLTHKAFIHGGYNTGDMGRVDEDGFVHITGRLARFAKIAGEMVPLDNVEAVLSAAFHAAEPESQAELAVASIPDETKGEKLVVLHTGVATEPAKLLAALDTYPALWKPKAGDFRSVAEIPKLGTGKRDLAALKKLAAG